MLVAAVGASTVLDTVSAVVAVGARAGEASVAAGAGVAGTAWLVVPADPSGVATGAEVAAGDGAATFFLPFLLT